MAITDAKRWLSELFAFHMGETQRLHRAAAAKGYGLNPVEFSRPYPSSSTVTNMNIQEATETATKPAKSSLGKRALLAGGLAALIGAGGLLAWGAKHSPKAASPSLAPQEYEIDWHVDLQTGEFVVDPPKRLE